MTVTPILHATPAGNFFFDIATLHLSIFPCHPSSMASDRSGRSVLAYPLVYRHVHPVNTMLPHLLPLLPRSLPLVRRIQFHYQSPDALVFCTLPPETAPKSGQTFAAAYVDRSRAPETECWIFSTLELGFSGDDTLNGTSTGQKVEATSLSISNHQDQLLAVLSAIARNPLPEHPNFATNHPPRLLLVGTIDSKVYKLLHAENLEVEEDATAAVEFPRARDPSGRAVRDEVDRQVYIKRTVGKMFGPGGVMAGRTEDEVYIKYLFPPTISRNIHHQLDGDSFPGLRWGICGETEEDFPLVLSRTEIPRSVKTLKLLPSVAVRRSASGADPGDMVAWCFLGVDSSLTSLHVEPEFRGRGLGKLLSKKLFQVFSDGGGTVNGSKAFGTMSREEAWIHADVGRDNVGSRRVMEGLGGKAAWEDYWCLVDLVKVLSVEQNRAGR
jgi:GNAT superfamily N-acetyltransferase